jgi:protein-L-isoaspartate O-methyltransferase
MIIPTGESWDVQELLLVEKRDGMVRTESVLPVRFVPLIRQR